MRHFIVARPCPEAEADRVWPWLGLVPSGWRGAAGRLARPRALLPLVSADGRVAGHALHFLGSWPAPRVALALAGMSTGLSPVAHGWLAAGPPPLLAGVAWRTGRLYGLAAVLSVFVQAHGPLGRRPAGLSLLLIGENARETASAARFLARRVHRLCLACPAEHFRNRLAWQILTECGLAMRTTAEAPGGGWDVAVDLRASPPSIVVQGRRLKPRPHFPAPLLLPPGHRVPPAEEEHPVWAECHLACLPREDEPPLPSEPTLRAVTEVLALSERVGLRFSLSDT